MFIAGKSINVEREGKLVALKPGEPCPEAATWDHDVLLRCMRVGQVLNVDKPLKDAGPSVLRVQAQQTAVARATAERVAPASVRPLSTSEANHGSKAASKSTSAENRKQKKAS